MKRVQVLALTLAALLTVMLLAITGCTRAPAPAQAAAPTTQAPAPAAQKATTGQQEAFATKLRGVMMDNLALNMVVEATDRDAPPAVIRPDGYAVLVIRKDYMSETLARQILHAGLLDKARQMDFVTVRFENAGPLDHARIWIYSTTNGQAWTGWRRCDTDYKQLDKYMKATQAQKDAMKYPTTCTYELSDGLAL